MLSTGESGTGKEVLAKRLHERSPRRRAAFIRLKCASLSEGVLESELFGHEKGAFTGAIRQPLGRFEQADRGTLFFDEIGAADLRVQLRLLRVLQEREFERVGGTETLQRCASHRRDQCGFSGGGPQGEFSRRSLLLPQCHRAQAPAFGRIFHSQAGCGQRRADDAELAADGEGFREARCSFERHSLRSALNRYHGVISQVAEAVGLSRKSLYAKLEHLEIDYERYRLRL